MQVVNLIQGTDEWHQFRRDHFPASEAPAVMNEGLYELKSSEDLALFRLGIKEIEVSDYKQKIFDEGHRMEACARPLMEKILGESLSNITAFREIDCLGKPLSASLDGITFDGKIVFEHKMFGEKLAENIKSRNIRPGYYWQLEQQLLVSGAEKVIFVTSDAFRVPDGIDPTSFNFYSNELLDEDGKVYYTAANQLEFMFYEAQEGRVEELILAWKQFEANLPNLVINDESWQEIATNYLNIQNQIDNLKNQLKGLENFGGHLKSQITGIVKEIGTNRLIGSGLDVKKNTRKGILDKDAIIENLYTKLLPNKSYSERNLAQTLGVSSLDYYRKPESISWQVNRVKNDLNLSQIVLLLDAMKDQRNNAFNAVKTKVSAGSFSF